MGIEVDVYSPEDKVTRSYKLIGGVPLVDTRYEERLRLYIKNILPTHYSLGRTYVEVSFYLKQSILVWNVELIMKNSLLMVPGEPRIDLCKKRKNNEN